MTTTGMRGNKDGKRVLFILQCILYYYIYIIYLFIFLFIYLFSKFKTFLDVNRWVYDKERGISIKTKNPQRAKDQAILPKDQIEMNGIALGARVTDGKLTRSSRLLTKQNTAQNPFDVLSDDEGDRCIIRKQTPQPKKQKVIARSTIKWTPKMLKLLAASVKKHKGKAGNGRIAWTLVSKDLKLNKRAVQAEWKKIARNQDPVLVETEEFNDECDDECTSVADVTCTDDCSSRGTLPLPLQTPPPPPPQSASVDAQLKALIALVNNQDAKINGLMAKIDEGERAAREAANSQQLLATTQLEKASPLLEDRNNKLRKRRRSKKSCNIPEGSKVMSFNDMELYQASVIQAEELNALKQANLLLKTMRN
jgi:hypothetical protein